MVFKSAAPLTLVAWAFAKLKEWNADAHRLIKRWIGMYEEEIQSARVQLKRDDNAHLESAGPSLGQSCKVRVVKEKKKTNEQINDNKGEHDDDNDKMIIRWRSGVVANFKGDFKNGGTVDVEFELYSWRKNALALFVWLFYLPLVGVVAAIWAVGRLRALVDDTKEAIEKGQDMMMTAGNSGSYQGCSSGSGQGLLAGVLRRSCMGLGALVQG